MENADLGVRSALHVLMGTLCVTVLHVGGMSTAAADGIDDFVNYVDLSVYMII